MIPDALALSFRSFGMFFLETISKKMSNVQSKPVCVFYNKPASRELQDLVQKIKRDEQLKNENKKKEFVDR